MARQHPHQGYTLLEVVVVLAILIITAALAVPTMENMMSGDKLVAAGDIVKSRLNEMRTRAREQGRSYKMVITENGDLFQVEPIGQCDGGAYDVKVEDRLPRDIVFKGATAADRNPDANGERTPNSTTEIVILSDGTASMDYAVSIGTSGNGRPMVVRLRGQTGAVTAGFAEEGGQ